MERKLNLRIEPLEERIVFDAAIGAVIAQSIPSLTDTSAAAKASTAPIIFVDGSAKGTVHNGNSWSTAYTDLQSALDAAEARPGAEQIWVARGTYVPSQIYSPDGVLGGASGLNDPHLKTFDIPTNVSVYGGFKAGMTSLSQANPNLFPTVLNGDQLGNDINNPSNPNYVASKADNSWHVVTIGDDITQLGANVNLNGLTIINGYANGPAGTPTFGVFTYNHNFGGGVYAAFDSTINISNTTFKYNYTASDGGGIFSNNNNITVSNSTFLNNSAVVRGGGLEFLNTFEGTTSHTGNVINSYFQNNTSTVFGGAIVGEGSYPNLNSALNIQGSTFVNNTSPEGGAIVIDSLTTNINASSFIGNVATVAGGALATTNIVDSIIGGPNEFVTTIQNSLFSGNIALGDPAAHEALNNFLGMPIGINFSTGGGALLTYVNGFMVVKDSTFVGNIAKNGDGGAILNGDSSGNNVFNTGLTSQNASTTVLGSTFIGNLALNGNGGAIASETDHILPADPSAIILTVKNSTITGNYSSGNGGGLYADTSTLTDTGNIFLLNNGNLGDQLYAKDSVLNGKASNSYAAYINQLSTNKFLLLNDNSIELL